jgi:hypothetical protein
VEQGEMRYLTTEVAGGFSEVCFGLYAKANAQENSNRAWFDSFEMR